MKSVKFGDKNYNSEEKKNILNAQASYDQTECYVADPEDGGPSLTGDLFLKILNDNANK